MDRVRPAGVTGRAVPAGIDVTRPNIARVYDALLGGKDNFAADRAFIETVMRQTTPDAPLAAQANRAFLRRVVRYLAAETGITQFLDIGSGLPTQGNVSQVAQEINPAARVVYVDNDPMVYTTARPCWSTRRLPRSSPRTCGSRRRSSKTPQSTG
jgi:hypothetical protein